MKSPLLFLILSVSALGAGIEDCIKEYEREAGPEGAISAFIGGPATPATARQMLLSNHVSQCLKDGVRDGIGSHIAFRKVLLNLERARFDKQLGGGGAAAGSTSVTASPSAPSFASLALESGAITQTTSGAVTTFKANALGFARFLLGSKHFPECPESSDVCGAPAARALRDMSFSVAFDTSRESAVQTPTEGSASSKINAALKNPIALLTGGPSRVESVGFRYEFLNRRSLHDKQYWIKWQTLADGDAATKAAAKEAGENFLVADFINSQVYRDALGVLESKLLLARTGSEVTDILDAFIKDAVKTVEDAPDFLAKAVKDSGALQRLRAAQDAVVRTARKTFSISTEYTFLRPRDQPELHNFKLISAGNPFRTATSNNTLVSINAGMNIYHQLPEASKVGRFRDVHAAWQLDQKLPRSTERADFVFTLAGYYQYQRENALIMIPAGRLIPNTPFELPGEAATLLAPKGHIHVHQAKFTVSIGESGIKFPFSATYANRTELRAKPEKRISFGIAYDLDKLLR